MRNPKPPRPNQRKREPIEFTLKELFCVVAAFSGRPVEEVREWKIPYFFSVYRAYQKDIRLRRTEL